MQADALAKSSKYSIRHWIIAPHEALSRAQMREVLLHLAKEFAFDVSRAVVVEHKKHRSTEAAFDTHWHVLVGEIDPVNNSTLRCSFDRILHELIGRFTEFKFGHKFVPGKHTTSVIKGLKERGETDAAAQLEKASQENPTSNGEAYTHSQQQIQKRAGVDLPKLRQIVKSAFEQALSRTELEELLAAENIFLAEGEKKDTWILVDKNAEFIGSLSRLAGKKKNEIAALMGENYERTETTDIDRSGDIERDTGNSSSPSARERHACDYPGNDGPDPKQNSGLPGTTSQPSGDIAPKTGLKKTGHRNTETWLKSLSQHNSHVASLLARANMVALSPIERIEFALWDMEETARFWLNSKVFDYKKSDKIFQLQTKVRSHEDDFADKQNTRFELEFRLKELSSHDGGNACSVSAISSNVVSYTSAKCFCRRQKMQEPLNSNSIQ